jgi:2'-5' RNA ligase
VTATGRAFVAVVPPTAVLDAVEEHVAPLRKKDSSLRWIGRDQWHLTIQFLGNHVDLDGVAAALEHVSCASASARLGGAGAMPKPRHARVVWIGTAEGAAHLADLARSVAAVVTPLGHEPEHRDFHPHLTVARRARPGDARTIIDALDAPIVGPRWSIDEIVLVRSVTKSTGAEHSVVTRVALA